YQLGLGYSPVQSGLLIMPQPLAAIGLRLFTPGILARYGYRGVLLANTFLMGVLIVGFMTIRPGTPVWLIVKQAACFGFLASLQYTSLGTLAFADLSDNEASMGSSIASTVQQMSMSFGVAVASLLTVAFVGTREPDNATILIGIHRTLLTLGLITIGAALIFFQLRREDGSAVSRHNVIEPAEPVLSG